MVRCSQSIRGEKRSPSESRASRALGLKRRREDAQRFQGAVVLAAVEEATCVAAIGVAIASFAE